MAAEYEHNPANGCPVCHGPLWDNREKKRNPKAPDFKCKDKGCEGVIWPPKEPKGGRGRPATAPQQEYSRGPHIPDMDGPYQETGSPPEAAPKKMDTLLAVYTVCWDHAFALAKRDFGADMLHTAVAAQAATLLITAKDAGAFR